MATKPEGKDTAQKGNEVMPGDYAQRAALAVNQLVPGPHRDKAIARIFECSVRFAKYLRAGRHWTIDRLNVASQRIAGFDAYLASPDFHTRLDQIARELDEMRANFGMMGAMNNDAGQAMGGLDIREDRDGGIADGEEDRA